MRTPLEMDRHAHCCPIQISGFCAASFAISLLESFRRTDRLRSTVFQFFNVVFQNLQCHIYVVEMRPEGANCQSQDCRAVNAR